MGKSMGFSEKEIWHMTLRKIDKLWTSHCIFYGIPLSKPEDAIPEDVI